MPRPKRLVTIGRPVPRAVELELLRALRPMVRQVQASIATVGSVGDARALGVALRRSWSDTRIRALVGKIGAKAEAAASRPWGKLEAKAKRDRMDAKRAPPEYDGRKLLDTWSREAAGLITSVRDEVAEGMRRDVLAALEAGTPIGDLRQRWIQQGVPVEWGTLEGRVKVIAQHQISILHARVQSERARAVGVSQFVWRTQGDDRVREAHQDLEGTRHAYTDPPSEGLPGEPVGCRCWAESVVPDELVAELGLGAVFG